MENKCNKLKEYKPKEYKPMIITKNKLLVYFKIIEEQLIDMFSTSTIIRKINNANYMISMIN